MPINKKILDALLKEIEELEDKGNDNRETRKNIPLSSKIYSEKIDPLKKNYLLPTEKQLFFYISNHYKLTMLAIDDPGIAWEIWLKGILPLLLKQHGLNNEEWERICDIGDSDKSIKLELRKEWTTFFKNTIEKGLVDKQIIKLINEGKLKVEKLRSTTSDF
ncbi:MAG: hypothetical protein ACTSPG_01485 [Candidatus Hodarchaeales archaeon]